MGAALLEGDGGYAARVMQEQSHMRRVADGGRVALNASNAPPPQAQPSATTLPLRPLSVDFAPAAPASGSAGAVEQVALLR